MVNKEQIKEFIRSQRLAVISTVGPDNKPESAVLEFGETDDLEIIFDTFKSSRKYKNIQSNNNVSLVIGWDNNKTVQFEGLAEEISGPESEKYKRIYWIKNPEAEKWSTRQNITYFKIHPIWLRYTDLNTDPWYIFEMTDF